MTPYLLMKSSIANKMKYGLTPEQLPVEQEGLRRKADVFFSIGRMSAPEYEEIIGLIDAMVPTK